MTLQFFRCRFLAARGNPDFESLPLQSCFKISNFMLAVCPKNNTSTMMNLKLPTCDCEDATAKTIIQKTVARQRRISYQKTPATILQFISVAQITSLLRIYCVKAKNVIFQLTTCGFDLRIVPIGLEQLFLEGQLGWSRCAR